MLALSTIVAGVHLLFLIQYPALKHAVKWINMDIGLILFLFINFFCIRTPRVTLNRLPQGHRNRDNAAIMWFRLSQTCL